MSIKTKNYGSLTIYLNYFYEIEKIFGVPRASFNPVPNVDSAVVKFQKRQNKFKVLNEEKFFNLVKDAFHQKRKNLKNNLGNYDLNKIGDILSNYNLSLTNRAEEIPIKVFVAIANNL